MTWTVFNIQLFLTQLLQDLWTSALTGTSFEDLTTLVSQLWLQGTFYNLTPDEIHFFTLILYIILHSNEHCSSSDSNNHQSGTFCPLPWLASSHLTITALLILVLAIGLITILPWDWSLILLLVSLYQWIPLSIGITYIFSCVLLLGYYFLCTT